MGNRMKKPPHVGQELSPNQSLQMPCTMSRGTATPPHRIEGLMLQRPSSIPDRVSAPCSSGQSAAWLICQGRAGNVAAGARVAMPGRTFMPVSLYDASVPVMLQMLGALSGVIDKAAAHCADRKVEPAALLTARLYPNMYMFQKQVQVACDWARNTAGRLAGIDIPKTADDETSFDDLKSRISRAVEFLKSVDAAAVEAGADRDIRWAAGPNTREMNGADFVLHQALPQFFFHVTTAYDILRHNGVELAKRDFMGQVPRMRTISA
jgi:hypothetical protein